MLRVINPNKITRQAFFHKLINYLYTREDVSLRQLKQVFADINQLDRAIDLYVEKGYIKRSQRRYSLQLPLLTSLDSLELDEMVIVDDQATLYQEMRNLRYQTVLTNKTNDLKIIEVTDFERKALTLANYFYQLQHTYPLSIEQENLYQIIGDVNPDYALKYLSTLILKFLRKDLVVQKRPDIFCQTLVLLGYLQEKEEQQYQLRGSLDKEGLIYRADQ